MWLKVMEEAQWASKWGLWAQLVLGPWPGLPLSQFHLNGPPKCLATAVPARIRESPIKVQIKDKISSRAEGEKPTTSPLMLFPREVRP